MFVVLVLVASESMGLLLYLCQVPEAIQSFLTGVVHFFTGLASYGPMVKHPESGQPIGSGKAVPISLVTLLNLFRVWTRDGGHSRNRALGEMRRTHSQTGARLRCAGKGPLSRRGLIYELHGEPPPFPLACPVCPRIPAFHVLPDSLRQRVVIDSD